MRIFPDRTSISDTIFQIKSPYRYLVTIVFVTSMMFGWWILIYRPVSFILAGYAQQHGALCKECASSISCLKSLQSIQTSLKQLRVNAQQERSAMNDSWISVVMKTAATTPILLTSYQADAECMKNWYSCAQARFKLTGKLDQICLFLKQLHDTVPALGCTQCTILHSEQGIYSMSALFAMISFESCECSGKKTPSTYKKAEGLGG